MTAPSRPAPEGAVHTSLQGTLALDYGEPAPVIAAPELRLVAGGRTELEAFAHRFARAVVEVIAGDRGPSQLLRWTSEPVYAELQQRAALLAAATPSDRRVRRLRSHVRSVHLFCPSPQAVEISVHVRTGARSRAVAARLELVDRRWCCTALDCG